MIPGRVVRLALFIVLTLTSTVARAEGRDGFALVLGGGGAKGFAHVGVFRALDELGMTPSVVIGTSMGAIMGALYASGMDADAIEDVLARQNWTRLLLDRDGAAAVVQGEWSTLPRAQVRLRIDAWPPRLPTGASQGHAIEALLGRFTGSAVYAADQDFDALPIPFRAVATDLQTGEARVFARGPLAHLVRASGSLPAIFVPVPYEGRYYVDGGFVDNLPLDAARELGFRRALVVDVSNTSLIDEAPPVDLFDVVSRTGRLAQRAQNSVDAGEGDVVLRVDLRAWNFLSFYDAAAIIDRGYDAVMQVRDELGALASASGPLARRPRPRGPGVETVEVEAVEIQGARRLSAWSVRKRLGVAVGDEITLPGLYERAEELSRQSIFEAAWIETRRTDQDGVRVIAHVQESDRPELELAANYRDEIGPGAVVRLRLDNRLGAGSSRVIGWRISPESAVLRADTSVPVRGSRHVEVWLGGGWINERVDVDRTVEDTWNFQRGVLDGDLVFAQALDRPALRLGFEIADGRRHLASRDRAGEGRLAWRAVRLTWETWTGGGISTWPTEGVSVVARRGLEVFGGRSDGWSIEGGWVERLLERRRVGVNFALGGAWASSDLPVSLQARAGGPRGWVGQDPGAIIAPQLAWARLGFDFYVNREVRFELAGALGWAGQESLDERPPLPGAQLRLVWESALGPIQLGWAGGRGREAGLVLDVGDSF